MGFEALPGVPGVLVGVVSRRRFALVPLSATGGDNRRLRLYGLGGGGVGGVVVVEARPVEEGLVGQGELGYALPAPTVQALKVHLKVIKLRNNCY